jgi:hypothetical protein
MAADHAHEQTEQQEPAEGRKHALSNVVTERHLRNKALVLADEERLLLVEARSRYGFLTSAELDEGLQRMRADAAQAGWIDLRSTYSS